VKKWFLVLVKYLTSFRFNPGDFAKLVLEMNAAPSNHHKTWNPIFLTERNHNDERTLIQSLQSLKADGDILDRFWEPYEGGAPSFRSEELKKFCQGSYSASILTNVSVRDIRKIWLDDREYSTGYSREYHHRLAVPQLYLLLTQKVRTFFLVLRQHSD
jgi:hypothetical protein